MEKVHHPVLLNEVIDFLQIKPAGRYVDGTLGYGGHSEEILRHLNKQGRLLGLDVDPAALKFSEDRLQLLEDQTITRRVNFRGLQGVFQEIGWTGADGILLDLGISSPQLVDTERGISFQVSAPLDMRLDPSLPQTALSLLQDKTEEELAEIFKTFGEFKQAKRLARYLKHDVTQGKLTTTEDLAGFCHRVLGRQRGHHPATRVFLALRASVNDELGALMEFLESIPSVLNPGGRVAIISYHSLEDKLVKEKFRSLAADKNSYSIVTRKPVIPSATEINSNPRSRSAKLRILEKNS